MGPDMNGTHQILIYVDGVTLIGDDIRTIKNVDTSVLLNACKDIVLAVNTQKTKYMEVGHHLGFMTNEHITIGSNSYE